MQESGKILLRAEATKAGGAGHLMRCLALAQAWVRRGGMGLFVFRECPEFLETALHRTGFLVKTLVEEDDAAATACWAREEGVRWVVLDGYEFDLAYEQRLREFLDDVLIAAIDDRVRPSAADLFVLPSLPRVVEDPRYQGVFLSGWNFALIREEFLKEYVAASESSELLRVLVVLGGTDAADLARSVGSALGDAAMVEGWQIRVIDPRHCAGDKKEDNVEWLPSTPELSPLLLNTDVIVCTASTIALEACACGVPQILLTVAENQSPVAEALVAAGAAVWAEGDDAPRSVVLALKKITPAASRLFMGERAKGLVDGRGSSRVARALASCDFSFRPVSMADSDMLYQWANDPMVRTASFHSEPIARDQHERWMSARLADPSSWLRLAVQSDGDPFAILRFEKGDDHTSLLSISISATHRGLGLGPHILRRGCQAFLVDHPGVAIRAVVKPANRPSLAAFRKAGFVTMSTDADRIIFGWN